MTDPHVIAQEIVDTYLAGTDEVEGLDPEKVLVNMIASAIKEAREDADRAARKELEGRL